MKKILYLFAFLAVSIAGAQDFTGVISSYLNSNRTQLGLQPQDIEDITIKSQSFSKSMQLHTVYVAQNYQGIEIFNSVSSFAVKNNQVVYASSGFVSNLSSKINTTNPGISAVDAISRAAGALGIPAPSNLELLEASNNSYVFSNGNISLENIPVNLVYHYTNTGKLLLAWDLSLYLLNGSHYYSVRIDAMTGALLETHDWVSSCDFGDLPHIHGNSSVGNSVLFSEASNLEAASGGAQYRVFAVPLRNPDNGPDTLENSPSNDTASPFGWHDTDGASGSEYTITRGNNVWSQEDLNNNNGTGASPDGGPTLDFDFPYGLPQPPINFIDAATVNLFYWNNLIHDITYQYGFDEVSGNFQENNYGNGGLGSDSVNADAQDGGGTNNANFATPPDGQNPRMQMYIWSGGIASDLLIINSGPLAGGYDGVPAGFGGAMPNPAITEDLVLVTDDDSGVSTDPNDACDPLTNAGALSGKIAVIRRGECEFGFKSLAAQNAGAIAVIIVNNVPGAPIEMGAGAVGGSVNIPCFMISQEDGEPIITELMSGSINGTIDGVAATLDRDGDLDNEIIVHEYGHGISNRLTGGPAAAGCLQNAEQMGEGWSDYFGLFITMQVGDLEGDIRGMASYASGNPNGIREAPYSTDFAINDYTYADTNANVSQPHGIGFVWATMLWEMTWDLIDQYGFDPDVYNGTGGNNIAMQLVMDGLKLQVCSPGFIDGRDAILQADENANGGANRCLIWNAFARRGCGLTASQGSSQNRGDQVEAFDVPSDCQLGVNDNGGLGKNFIIYPNPSNGDITIKSVIDAGNVTISIYDLKGRMVFTSQAELHDRVEINASNLRAGVYVIQIQGATYSQTDKLIIN